MKTFFAALAERDRTFTRPVNWTITITLTLFHIGAVAALFLFTWKALAVALALWWISGSLGIGMGYHRLLTHRGYKTYKPIEYFLTLCATLALEGGPIGWVATHRLHHQLSDKEGDPHSPRDGGFWSHMGWILTGQANHNHVTALLPYVPDLRRDRFHRWISRWHYLTMIPAGILCYWIAGWPGVFWGIFLRTVAGLHFTYLVNSATHMWGTQRFRTTDNSRNSFWVAMLSWGEGWHNNHHAHPQSARHGLAWYEIDVNWYGIQALHALGLAWDIKLPRSLEAEPPQPARVPERVEELAPVVSGD
jgi:fatty-acid desaturase